MGTILLGITLILWALALLGLLAIGSHILGIFAGITGIVYLLEGFGAVNVHVPTIRRRSAE